MASYTITVDASVTIRLADGTLLKKGESKVLQEVQIDEIVIAALDNGWISSVPTIPTDAASLARYQSDLDDDPFFGHLAKASTIHAPVADLTALKALEDYVDMLLILVAGAVGKLYRFDASSTDADDGDTVIIPDDITHPAPGRWLKM